MVEELRGLADQLADLARRNEGLALEVGQLRERTAGQAETIAELRRRAEVAEEERAQARERTAAAEAEREDLRERLAQATRAHLEARLAPAVIGDHAGEIARSSDAAAAHLMAPQPGAEESATPAPTLWQRVRRAFGGG